jgi:hypothetical protein
MPVPPPRKWILQDKSVMRNLLRSTYVDGLRRPRNAADNLMDLLPRPPSLLSRVRQSGSASFNS